MRTVILVGTAHKFQIAAAGDLASAAGEFLKFLHDLCSEHKVRAVAEEMNSHALQEKGATESVAQRLCAELRLLHHFSDPCPQERYALSIRQDNDIRAEHLFDGWTQEQIEADVLARGSATSDRICERFWWQKLQEINVWPLVFICGADHFAPLATLLREAGVNVVEPDRDWDPHR